jgi:hypothetical protein
MVEILTGQEEKEKRTYVGALERARNVARMDKRKRLFVLSMEIMRSIVLFLRQIGCLHAIASTPDHDPVRQTDSNGTYDVSGNSRHALGRIIFLLIEKLPDNRATFTPEC